MAEMKKVKRVIQATMKHKGAKLLFNQPVDPEALGLSDYFEVIKHPIDLATILERLNADDYYASASEVEPAPDSNEVIYGPNSVPLFRSPTSVSDTIGRHYIFTSASTSSK